MLVFVTDCRYLLISSTQGMENYNRDCLDMVTLLHGLLDAARH